MKASDSARGLRLFLLTVALGAMSLGVGVRAQIPSVKSDVRAARGLPISPVYEGWYEVDGKKYVLFAYYNRNLKEIVDVPIGPRNHVSPGPQDQGQPTRFFPVVYYGVFAAAVPKDQQATEVTWTLTANGQTVSIPVFLDPLYFIAPQRENGGAWPGNRPPVVKFDPAGASGQGPYGVTVSRTATVARPLTLDAWVTDDGLPPPRRESRAAEGRRAPSRQEVPQGLALSWQVYRGAGAVTFSDQAPAVNQGKAHTTVTFSQPGDFLEDVLGPPDLVVRAKPFTTPGRSSDVHFEVEVPLPLTEPRWVRASETKPSVKERQIAHHATTNLIRPQTPEAIAAERAERAVLREPTMLHNLQPHMHYRGKVQTLEAIYLDGRREVVNQVSRFTNTWHINYIYDPDYAPVFPKGTVLVVTTIHDNTAGNENNPDPRQAVIWGDRTVDEMAHLSEQLIYITEEDYQRIVEERRNRASTQN